MSSLAHLDTPSAPVPAIRRLSVREQSLLTMVSLILVELFVILLVQANSTFLPGNWSGLFDGMIIYLAFALLALIIILARPSPNEPTESLRTGRFLTHFLLGASVTTVALLFLFQRYATPAPLSGVAQLQDLVFIAAFVGPVEEMFFRVALPLKFGWLLPSTLVFTALHTGAYTAAGISSTSVSLTFSLAEIAIIGSFLWLVNAKVGFGAAVGVHVAYDLVVTGAVGGVAVAAVHLGLVPV